MNRIFFSVAVILFSANVFAQKYVGDSWAKVKSTNAGTLSVIYYAQPGIIGKGPDGKVKGVCVDILQDFVAFVQDKYGKSIKVNYVAEETVFSDFLSNVKTTPNIMGITSVTVTEERKKFLKFTPPFLTNPVVLITHKDAPPITSLENLSSAYGGYTAEVITGSTHAKHMENIKNRYYPTLKLAYNSSGPLILDRIKTNPKLFTILDFTEFVDATRKQLPVKRQNVDISKEDLAFIMAQQSDWDVIWNEFMTPEYKSSIRYRKVIVDNLGANFLSVVR
jgi:ABC-type amino acid transport substrate-binding protein